MNIDEIAPGIYISGVIPDKGTYITGTITHILNMCSGPDDLNPEYGFSCYHAASHDDGSEKGDKYWIDAIRWGEKALRNPDNRLLVHCIAGINRSPSMVYGILRYQGYPPSIAWWMVDRGREGVFPRYVNQIERALNGIQ